jgi:excisionase family DNA binding protein
MGDSDPNDGCVGPLQLMVSVNISLAGEVQEALLRVIGRAAHPAFQAHDAPVVPMTRTDDQWLSLSQAAEFIGVSTSTLYKYASQGKLEYRKLAGRLQFRRSALDGFLEKHVRHAGHDRQHRSIITAALGSGK